MVLSQPNLLSINLEDYFQVAPLRQAVPHRHWPRFDLRVERNTETALKLLERHGAKATFFTLGWLADARPDLLREIAAQGHEIACKGYYHSRFEDLGLDPFIADMRRGRDAIEDATGRSVLGYRIAEGSLPIDTTAPFAALARAGFKYDSSIRPFGLAFRHLPAWQHIRELVGDDWQLTEVPLSGQLIMGVPMPVTGGNYLRQTPDFLFNHFLAKRLAMSAEPWHFYFHIWELDPEQPRVGGLSRLERLRQYRNLAHMAERIETIVSKHAFQPIASYLGIEAEHREPRPLAEIAQAPSMQRRKRKKVSVVIPCYHEEDTLPYLAGTLASFEEKNRATLDLSFVFVDDGSKDATWRVLNALFGDRPNCILVKHKKNRGIAAATMTGILAAKDEVVCGIDADCSFDPHTLAEMIPLLGDGIDMVQASPYHPKGGVRNVPEWRLVLSKNLSRVYNVLLNHRFKSYTACFRVYRRSAIKDFTLDDERFLGIAEMFVKLDQAGSRIVEFPTVLEARLLGASKMKTVPVIAAHLGMIWKLIFKRLGGKREAGKSAPSAVEREAR